MVLVYCASQVGEPIRAPKGVNKSLSGLTSTLAKAGGLKNYNMCDEGTPCYNNNTVFDHEWTSWSIKWIPVLESMARRRDERGLGWGWRRYKTWFLKYRFRSTVRAPRAQGRVWKGSIVRDFVVGGLVVRDLVLRDLVVEDSVVRDDCERLEWKVWGFTHHFKFFHRAYWEPWYRALRGL